MRGAPLDAIDQAMLAAGWCSDCGRELIPGPRGGAAQNFYCINRTAECRQGFNLTFLDKKLAMAERIGEVDNERFKLYFGGD